MLAGKAWILFALGTAVCWGLGYALSERVLKAGIHPTVLMVFTGTVYFIMSWIIAYSMGHLNVGIEKVKENQTLIFDILIISITLFLGVLFINIAIDMKNATLVNLIEISYPVFTLIFAYIIFKELQVDWSTGFGALLIFAGVGIIFLKG